MWMMPLHLHVNQKYNYDDMIHLGLHCLHNVAIHLGLHCLPSTRLGVSSIHSDKQHCHR